MKERKTDLLPLGSIIQLIGGHKKIMITGRLQKESITGEQFDYCAVLWPEGMLDSESVYLFNHDDIETLHFIGMQNEEEFRFRHVLDRALTEAAY